MSQDRVWVEHYRRLDGGWHLADYRERADVLRLDSIECELPSRELDAKVDVQERLDVIEPDGDEASTDAGSAM